MAASSSVVAEAESVTRCSVEYGSREMRTRNQLARKYFPLKQTLFSNVIIGLAYQFMHNSSSVQRMTKGEDDVLIGR